MGKLPESYRSFVVTPRPLGHRPFPVIGIVVIERSLGL